MSRSLMAGLTAVALLAAGGAAAAGTTYRLGPASSSFSGSGDARIATPTGSIMCSVSVRGTTSTPARITAATLGGATGCGKLQAMNLPWRIVPYAQNQALIHHVSILVGDYGRCGPNEVNATISGGLVTVQDHLPSADGVCAVNLGFQTRPALSVTTGE